MKLHLSAHLFRALIFQCIALFVCSSSHGYAEDISLAPLSGDIYSNDSVIYSSRQTGGNTWTDYEAVTFSNCSGPFSSSSSSVAYGGAVYNDNSIVMLNNNGVIDFSYNRVGCYERRETYYDGYYYGYGSYKQRYYRESFGGAIYNTGNFQVNGNENILFHNNLTYATNSSSDSPFYFYYYGGAIYNAGTFSFKDNGNVSFWGNAANEKGGAIYNSGNFSVIGNGNVAFRQNWEGVDMRLRSIYHASGSMSLDASAGHSITFYDSIYSASGTTLKLNETGTGDIIFTGATTEEDLRLMKGAEGTTTEIQNSRTSEIATNATLCGGRLIVEDGAILKGRGITFTAGANATIRLNSGTLDETGYAVAVSSGSGLEFDGKNTLAAVSVSLADNSFLSFILDEAQTVVNWNANLNIQGGLSLNLTHEDKSVHDTYALLSMQSRNAVTGWDAANLTISGASAEHLVWENNTLYYRPMLVQENGDTTLDKDVDTDAAGGTIGGKVDVNIDGNGHTLSVKNEVQLVQMALKDGIVKLEGENNGIVSVTLTEGGELVLTAGAGLKTGDIISMVASGKGELVISGDITLDNKGMKGKAGAQATVSHADAKVLGDATISNVRVEDSVIDLAEGSTVTFSHVSLAAGSRITDDPATLALDDVTAELQLGVNAAVVSVDEVLRAGSTLVQNGNETMSLTLAQDAVVVQLEATTFDSVTLTGASLVLQLSGVETEFFNGADYIAVTFTSGTGLATFGTDVEVLLTLDEEHFVHGYYVQGSDHTAMLFAANDKAVVTPEPATSTLSLLALAALAARRRRK